MSEIKVYAPATVSNVICGFDCLGFAMSEPFDEIVVRKIEQRSIIIHNDSDYNLPAEPEKNVAGVALQSLINKAGIDFGFEVSIKKGIKPGSGIGSSSASSAGAVFAANHLLGSPFSNSDLVEFAMEGEKLASGSRHPDNVAPCIYGGFVLARSTEPLDIVSLSYPQLWAVVIHPQVEIRTADARAVLPTEVPLKDAIEQWSNLGAFVAALAQNDLPLLSRSMKDNIVEPRRKHLLTGYDEIKNAAITNGALGCGISGSGPSMFALADNEITASKISDSIRDAFEHFGIDFNIHISQIDKRGVRIAE